MAYDPGVPTGIIPLSQDYKSIKDNFTQLDVSFGIDHYPFSNNTSNKGFHNQVTTPVYVANPVTGLPPATGTNPIFYAFQQYTAVGPLQYSRGPSLAVPTPLTSLHSGTAPIIIAPNGTTNVLDFTGITRAICTLFAMDTVDPVGGAVAAVVLWTGTTFSLNTTIGTHALRAASSGNILQIKNFNATPFSNVYWTLKIERLD